MKMLTKMMMVFFLVVLGFKASAQGIITVNASSPNTCDGKAYLNNVFGASNMLWYTTDSSWVLVQNGGDSVTGLCIGNYSMTFSDSSGFTVQYDFYIDADTLSPCASFGAYIGTVVPITDSINCNGELQAIGYGGTMPYSYLWGNGATNDMMSGLCSGTYYCTVTDANGCSMTVQANLFDSTNVSPCSSFGMQYTTGNASSPTQCDGSASVWAYGNTGLVSYNWSNGLGSSSQVVNLCSGYYTVGATDSAGCTATISIYVGYNADSTNLGNLYGWANTVDVSADGVCDGQVFLEIYGGTSPYNYMHNSGATGDYLLNLCAGAYWVTVVDALGDTLNLNYIIASPSNIIDNGGFVDSTIVDTVGTDLIQNCDLLYYSIDSAFISNFSFINLDSISVTWTVVDSSGAITITSIYTVASGAGVYEFVLQLFCPQRGVSDYLVARDRIFVDPSTMSVKEMTASEVKVYPNPFVSNVTIQLEDNEKSEVQITDLTGKVVYSQKHSGKELTLDLQMLASGNYILHLSNSKGDFYAKLIK